MKCICLIAILLITVDAYGFTGYLMVDGKKQAISIDSIDIDVVVSNRMALVRYVQIFHNNTDSVLEGRYYFAMPETASVHDFAIWEGAKRIPGVMLEKKSAERRYEKIKRDIIDPGLLSIDDSRGGSSLFSARVFPIPAMGTKRVEIEYQQRLQVNELDSTLFVPIWTFENDDSRADKIVLNMTVSDRFPFDVELPKRGNWRTGISEPNRFSATFSASDFPLTDGFQFRTRFRNSSDDLIVTAHRSPKKISVFDLSDPTVQTRIDDGYFEATAMIGSDQKNESDVSNFIFLFDNSLSSYGNHLQDALSALNAMLGELDSSDRFLVGTFNEDVQFASESPQTATGANVGKARQFLLTEPLQGSTDLKRAIERAIDSASGFGSAPVSIVVISDANPTLQTARADRIVPESIPGNVSISFLAAGENANLNLGKAISEMTNGVSESVSSGADAGQAARYFFRRVRSGRSANSIFGSVGNAGIYGVYPIDNVARAGTAITFVGRYRNPGSAGFYMLLPFAAKPHLAVGSMLPELEESNGYIETLWARARIDELLRLINRSGETKGAISEIVALSRKYKILTPYTSFLAAPRALLRPRLIQPGDPVIRIKADSNIVEIFAVLPFGETLPLRYLKQEGVWETRFLAPASMTDGTYACRLIMKDRDGNAYEEKKTFVIDSAAPVVKPKSLIYYARPGEEILLEANSDKDTLRLTARFGGGRAVPLKWDDERKTNTGLITIPFGTPSGSYKLRFEAEDFAHNQSNTETEVRISR
ncbi:MAG: VIT and VWA domain-containing protein [Pyrinomonadaceae bacterium]